MTGLQPAALVRAPVGEPDGDAGARRPGRPVPSPMRSCGSIGRTCCRRCPISGRSFRSAPASTIFSSTPACRKRRSCRVVADNLTQYMTEFIVWRVLDHHRQGALYRVAAGAQALARTAAAAGERHLGRHHGARQSRPRRGASAEVAWLQRQWLEPNRADGARRLDISRRQRADAVPQRDRHPRRAAAADAGNARHRHLQAAARVTGGATGSAARC